MDRMFRFLVAFVIGIAVVTLAQKATKPPPCTDRSSSFACQQFISKNVTRFKNRCQTDAEFAILDCCASCQTQFPQGYSTIKNTVANTNCTDDMLASWCTRFTSGTNTYLGVLANCDGPTKNNLAAPFRLCRKSCGYCGVNQTVAY